MSNNAISGNQYFSGVDTMAEQLSQLNVGYAKVDVLEAEGDVILKKDLYVRGNGVSEKFYVKNTLNAQGGAFFTGENVEVGPDEESEPGVDLIIKKGDLKVQNGSITVGGLEAEGDVILNKNLKVQNGSITVGGLPVATYTVIPVTLSKTDAHHVISATFTGDDGTNPLYIKGVTYLQRVNITPIEVGTSGCSVSCAGPANSMPQSFVVQNIIGIVSGTQLVSVEILFYSWESVSSRFTQDVGITYNLP